MRQERDRQIAIERGEGTLSFESGTPSVEVRYELKVTEKLARFEPEDPWEFLYFAARGRVTPLMSQGQRVLLQMFSSDDNQVLQVQDGRRLEVKVWGSSGVTPGSSFEISSQDGGEFFSKYSKSGADS
jgi:hypothetical protein